MNVNIPTFVTELGERMMNELNDEEIMSAVGSLDSDQWSDASSASPGLLHTQPVKKKVKGTYSSLLINP